MQCPNCGAENLEERKYCEECGERIASIRKTRDREVSRVKKITESSEKRVEKRRSALERRNKMLKRRRRTLIAIICLLFLIIVLGALMCRGDSDPTETVEHFFDAANEMDAQRINYLTMNPDMYEEDLRNDVLKPPEAIFGDYTYRVEGIALERGEVSGDRAEIRIVGGIIHAEMGDLENISDFSKTPVRVDLEKLKGRWIIMNEPIELLNPGIIYSPEVPNDESSEV